MHRRRGRLGGADRLGHRVTVASADGGADEIEADVVLVATGAHPRELPTAVPDGERILNWTRSTTSTSFPSSWSWSAPA